MSHGSSRCGGAVVSVIALAGDWHGDQVWANARLQSLGERGITTVLHVGDFGIWPGKSGKAFLGAVEAVCARYGIRLSVVPGNHEDWGRLTTLWENPKRRSSDGSLLPLAVSDRVEVLPRGWRWELGGRSLVALGGAPSVDVHSRAPGRDWWPEEQMTQHDVDHTVANGYADVMITHDAPGPPWATRPVQQILASNPMDWPATALDYARVGRERVTEAFLGVKPRLLVHGHYHCSGRATMRLPDADYDTTVLSLSMQRQSGNIALLTLKSLSIDHAS